MAECNDRPMSGNGVRVPIRRFDGDTRNDNSRHRSESEREGGNRRGGNRGYRTDPSPSQQRPSRWDNRNNRDGQREDDFHQDRRRTAADKEIGNDDHRDQRGRQNDRNRRHDDVDRDRDHYGSSEYYGRGESDDRFRRHRDDRSNDRDNRYNNDDRRRRGDDDDDHGRYRRYRERSDSGYRSDEYGDSRRSRHEEDRDSFHRRRRQPSRDFKSSDDDDDNYYDDDHDYHRKEKEKQPPKEQKEWPPSFQKDGDAFSFDVRSAMFYEPLSDFFYDPKSKLYYGNKKSAYFRYDEKEDPPFVEVQKMKKVEDAGENIAIDVSAPKVAPSKPKIAIKLSTKKVKSSKSTLAALKCDKQQQQQQPAMVSKAKQQEIANIGKWNEKQAELKEEASQPQDAALPPPAKQKVRTTVKGEPICMICKKKFPNLAKLRLHEKASELHKKNVLALQEKRRSNVAAKRKATETQQQQLYTDRAEKRRQLHGTELGASQSFSRLQDSKPPLSAYEPAEETTPGGDLFHESNVGHKMLQKMGFQKTDETSTITNGDKPKTANEHLRKEWDRIEAMAQKTQNRYR